MSFNLIDLIFMYMAPFALAIPIGLVLIFAGVRWGSAPVEPVRQRFNSAPVHAVSAPRQASVLVVDDSSVARAKLRRLFENAGYLVAESSDGVEALAQLALGDPYSVLITDLEMPNMDGFQLIAAVQGAIETENLPIVAITGNDEMQARVNDVTGLYGIFKKPWNDRELLKRVERLSGLRVPQAV